MTALDKYLASVKEPPPLECETCASRRTCCGACDTEWEMLPVGTKDRLVAMVEAQERQLRRLLNKVNRVTAFHRHGAPVPTDALTELANRQVEVEEDLRAELDRIAGEGGT
jgi:PleD family two-component response regulator